MRIARGVYVALGAVESARHLEQIDETGRFHRARRAGPKLLIGRLCHDRRQPADLELSTGAHGDVCTARLGDETGTCLHRMRVLSTAGGGINRNLIPADWCRQRSPFEYAREQVQLTASG